MEFEPLLVPVLVVITAVLTENNEAIIQHPDKKKAKKTSFLSTPLRSLYLPVYKGSSFKCSMSLIRSLC